MTVDKVLIYGQDNCKDCGKAQMLAQMQGVPYEYFLLGTDYTLDELVELVGGPVRSSPQVFVQQGTVRKHIGGYDDYRKSTYGV